jgi:alpha-tubulin suppressor-like RCC1 family protein
LPAGLSFSTATGDITGNPSGLMSATTFTISAINSGGSDAFDIDIEVVAPGLLTLSGADPFDFGTTATGGSVIQNFTVTNTGGYQVTAINETGLVTPFNFSSGTCGATLAAGASCNIDISFNAISTGASSDTISLNYHNGIGVVSATKALDGTGAPPAVLSISESDPYNYGTITVGNSADHTFTISNGGGVTATALDDLSLTTPYVYSGSFPGSGGTCTTTLAAGASCDINVTYQPTVSGVHPGSINIDHNDGVASQVVTRTITGTGENPALLGIDFASHDFGIASFYETMPTSDSGTWNANTNTPTLTNGSEVSGNFYSVNTAGDHDFGSGTESFLVNDLVISDGTKWTRYGAPPVKVFTITNSGDAIATGLSETGLALPFQLTGAGTCSSSLASGASCTLEVQVFPSAISAVSGSIALDYNDGVATQSVVSTLDVRGGKVIKIAGSGTSHCALFDSGKLKCWGSNTYGQLGQSDVADRGNVPSDMGANLNFVPLGTSLKARDIVGGENFFCAITRDDDVKCWGDNTYGQLGLGDTNNRGDDASEMQDNLPYVDLGSARKAKKVAAGRHSVCALLDNDKIKCWGRNELGQLGYEDTNDRGDTGGEMGDSLAYVDLGVLTAKEVATGNKHACAILPDDSVKCWGSASNGQLGYEDTTDRGLSGGQMGASLPFVNLGTSEFASKLVLGFNETCVILSTGGIKCWGSNSDGQLGHENIIDSGSGASQMGDNLAATSIGGGTINGIMMTMEREVCALLGSDVKCWGNGAYGGLGKDNTFNIGHVGATMGGSLSILDLGSGRTVKELGERSSCAVLDNNELKCWGRNNYGQLGLGDMNNRGDGPGEMGDSLPYVQLR